MFQISPSSYDFELLVRRSTPLEPLKANACSRFSLQMASAGETNNDTSKSPYKRATNNPLLQRKTNEAQDRRRRVFLKKVRHASDEKKWESRSEQVRNRCV